MTTFEGNLQLNGSEKVAIIASRFNHLIVDRLVEGASDSFKRHGGNMDNLNVILVPGAYELPFVLNRILKQDEYDGICCVGAVICGATPHFDYVSAEATKGIANATLKYDACVSFGLLTTDSISKPSNAQGQRSATRALKR